MDFSVVKYKSFYRNAFSFLATSLVGILLCGCSDSKKTYQVGVDMMPLLEDYQPVLIDLAAYDESLPKRWEIAYVYDAKNDRNRNLRIVGLPGERLKLDSLGLWIDDNRVTPPGINTSYYVSPESKGLGVNEEVEIPKGAYYVIGDNFKAARDSREIGLIPRESILGRLLLGKR